MSAPVPLDQPIDGARFGGKAASLSASIRAGFPVPGGWALDDALARSVAADDGPSVLACAALVEGGGAFAVRSSAVGEDGASASFAGQHLTRLHVRGRDALVAAIREVWSSGRDASALAYRQRLGLTTEVQMGVVVQRMAEPTCAGVLFTRNPVNGADERVVEVSWGLGEAVVAGLVTPDRYRFARGGTLLETVIGEKDVEIVPAPGGGTLERPVPEERASSPCLGASELAALEALAARCEATFDGASDIEFAFEGARLVLLQRRAVTR